MAGDAYEGVIKNPRGKIVGSAQKVMAYNIYMKHKNNVFLDENDRPSKTEAVRLAAADVGISERTVFNIIAEMESTGTLKSPSRKKMREDIYTKLSEDEKKAIRHTVRSFLTKNETPTVNKLLQAIKENESIRHNMSRTTLFNVLKKLGFIWEKRGGRKGILVEKVDI